MLLKPSTASGRTFTRMLDVLSSLPSDMERRIWGMGISWIERFIGSMMPPMEISVESLPM